MVADFLLTLHDISSFFGAKARRVTAVGRRFRRRRQRQFAFISPYARCCATRVTLAACRQRVSRYAPRRHATLAVVDAARPLRYRYSRMTIMSAAYSRAILPPPMPLPRHAAAAPRVGRRRRLLRFPPLPADYAVARLIPSPPAATVIAVSPPLLIFSDVLS